ncbi:MAG TPA: hypothetical protein VMP38_03300 [Candidatus Acidoferrum sp.]|nr:hypothetical protein [Candidatus Acidoferrum sp.]
MIGVKVQMGGIEYMVPPLTLGQLRRLEPKIRAMSDLPPDAGGISTEQIDAIGEIVSTALSRNYPDMTPERVLELIDVANAREVILAVLTGAGLKPGEAEAVTRPNGAISTDSSPPPVDTHTP